MTASNAGFALMWASMARLNAATRGNTSSIRRGLEWSVDFAETRGLRTTDGLVRRQRDTKPSKKPSIASFSYGIMTANVPTVIDVLMFSSNAAQAGFNVYA